MIFLVVAVAYAATADLTWRLLGADNLGLAFFPPAGVTLAALVLSPRRRWWEVVAAVLVAETGVDLAHGLGLGPALGYAAANAIEPLVGAFVLARLGRGRPLDLERFPGVLRFLVAAVGIGPAVGAALGSAVRRAAEGTAWLPAAMHWWAGDGLAVLAVGTAILMLGDGDRPRPDARELAEPVAAMAATLVVSVLAFWQWKVPPAILVLPVLVWVAVRCGVRGVSVASTIIAVVANLATAAGRGPFADLDMSTPTRLAWLQLLLATLIVTAWLLAIETKALGRVRAREEQERAARERAESVRAIGELSADLVRAVTVDDVVHVAEDHLRRLVPADHAVLTLYDHEADHFRPTPSSLPPTVTQAVAGWTLTSAVPGAQAMETGEPVWCASAQDLVARFPAAAGVVAELGTEAMGAIPVDVSGRSVGYLGIVRLRPEPFTPEEREELVAASRVIGQAVQRAELYEVERASRLAAEQASRRIDELLHQSRLESARLRESEERFKLLADQSPMVVWVHDDEGRPEWVNRTYCRFFGISRDEATDEERLVGLLHPDDGAAYIEAFRAAVAGRQPFHATARVRRADGEWRWIESWGQPRFGGDEYQGVVGTSVDVTEHKKAEAALRATAARETLRADILAGVETAGPADDALQLVVDNLVPVVADVAIIEVSRPDGRTVIGAHVKPARLDALLAASSRRGAVRAVTWSGARSVVTVTFDAGDGSSATLVAAIVDPERPAFDGDDRAFLDDVAQRVSIVLSAAHLRRAEHVIAITLQNALLPDEVCWDPDLEIEARYQAASDLLHVGGDWYDTFRWPDGHIGLMIGDVVGHNLESAAAMGRVRSAAAALATISDASPGRLLETIDQFARGPNGTGYATAACVVVDPATGRLVYSSAGHPPAMVVAPDGTVTRLDSARSTPLSTLQPAVRPEAEAQLEPGSVVVLYSDGLVERRSQNLGLGLARLEDALAAHRHEPTGRLVDTVIAAMAADSHSQDDDIAVACFRWTPAVDRYHREIPAEGSALAGLRRELREWLTERGVVAEHQHALLLAVGEAVTNVVDHAYHLHPGASDPAGDGGGRPTVVVDVSDHGYHLVARVVDRGKWRPPGPHSRDRGRGTAIMEALTDHVERTSGPDGTVVTLAVSPPRVSSGSRGGRSPRG
ncbi:MAG: SpoIIE family protein phosphatase [Acidimicrobiales bacterium]